VFKYMHGRRIGEEVALFYMAWAWLAEHRSNYAFADKVYGRGIARKAAPLERLQTRYREFQRRMYKAALAAGAESGVPPPRDAASVDLEALSRAATAAPPSAAPAAATSTVPAAPPPRRGDAENAPPAPRATLGHISTASAARSHRDGLSAEEAVRLAATAGARQRMPAAPPKPNATASAVFCDDEFSAPPAGGASRGTGAGFVFHVPVADELAGGMAGAGGGAPGWTNLGTEATRHKENRVGATAWAGASLPAHEGVSMGAASTHTSARAPSGAIAEARIMVFEDDECATRAPLPPSLPAPAAPAAMTIPRASPVQSLPPHMDAVPAAVPLARAPLAVAPVGGEGGGDTRTVTAAALLLNPLARYGLAPAAPAHKSAAEQPAAKAAASVAPAPAPAPAPATAAARPPKPAAAPASRPVAPPPPPTAPAPVPAPAVDISSAADEGLSYEEQRAAAWWARAAASRREPVASAAAAPLPPRALAAATPVAAASSPPLRSRAAAPLHDSDTTAAPGLVQDLMAALESDASITGTSTTSAATGTPSPVAPLRRGGGCGMRGMAAPAVHGVPDTPDVSVIGAAGNALLHTAARPKRGLSARDPASLPAAVSVMATPAAAVAPNARHTRTLFKSVARDGRAAMVALGTDDGSDDGDEGGASTGVAPLSLAAAAAAAAEDKTLHTRIAEDDMADLFSSPSLKRALSAAAATSKAPVYSALSPPRSARSPPVALRATAAAFRSGAPVPAPPPAAAAAAPPPAPLPRAGAPTRELPPGARRMSMHLAARSTRAAGAGFAVFDDTAPPPPPPAPAPAPAARGGGFTVFEDF